MGKKHFNIPIFIPELACPFQCTYCNQRKISGQMHVPTTKEINKIIDEHLTSIPQSESDIEIAFFGGNFTGISKTSQESYLELVQPYIKNGIISGIRISTRPDYIDAEILDFLKKHNVKTIELGAQSLDDEVLFKSKRGHKAKDVEISSQLILKEGFILGLQMMIGLPGDTFEKAKNTAQQIINLGANNTRIYPTLVIKDTKLEKLYNQDKFKPLSLMEAVTWSKELLIIFEKAKVDVIKMGLHPSDGLLSGHDLIAGPFHQSFRELVLTDIWGDLLKPLLGKKGKEIQISVPSNQYNYAIGYKGKNKIMLLGRYDSVKFIRDESLKNRDYKVTTFS